MLEAEGFTLQDGAWHKPDGSPWQITINSPSNFEVQSQRLAFAIADNWRAFGIDAAPSSRWTPALSGAITAMATFDAGSYWPGCGALPDSWDLLDASSGTNAISCRSVNRRPATPCAMRATRSATFSIRSRRCPAIIRTRFRLLTEFEKQFIVERPWLPMFGTSKFVPVVTTYWDGMPTADNFYEGPWWWWSLFKYHMPFIQPKSEG